jgi:predicted amidophosphoribosyltransferase
MSEPNYNIDPLFDSEEEEWMSCAVCQDDFIRYDKHCTMCERCVLKEEEDNE